MAGYFLYTARPRSGSVHSCDETGPAVGFWFSSRETRVYHGTVGAGAMGRLFDDIRHILVARSRFDSTRLDSRVTRRSRFRVSEE